jgi:hypothetical protein
MKDTQFQPWSEARVSGTCMTSARSKLPAPQQGMWLVWWKSKVINENSWRCLTTIDPSRAYQLNLLLGEYHEGRVALNLPKIAGEWRLMEMSPWRRPMICWGYHHEQIGGRKQRRVRCRCRCGNWWLTWEWYDVGRFEFFVKHHKTLSGWWFPFFMFHNIWDNPSHWLNHQPVGTCKICWGL